MSAFAIVFVEGDFEAVTLMATKELVDAYASGFVDGARKYGGDYCACYVMPEQEDDMRNDQRPEEVAKALAALEGHKRLMEPRG